MKSLLTLVTLVILIGCGNLFKDYTWDENAQRCRDNRNGQFVESVNCDK